jgi:hypothetical protein
MQPVTPLGLDGPAGIVTAVGSMALGLPLGLMAGYLGKGVDHAIMRFTEVVTETRSSSDTIAGTS